MVFYLLSNLKWLHEISSSQLQSFMFKIPFIVYSFSYDDKISATTCLTKHEMHIWIHCILYQNSCKSSVFVPASL